MTREQEIKDILKKISFQLTYKTKVLLFALLGVGILGLGLGFVSGHAELVWHALTYKQYLFYGNRLRWIRHFR